MIRLPPFPLPVVATLLAVCVAGCGRQPPAPAPAPGSASAPTVANSPPTDPADARMQDPVYTARLRELNDAVRAKALAAGEVRMRLGARLEALQRTSPDGEELREQIVVLRQQLAAKEAALAGMVGTNADIAPLQAELTRADAELASAQQAVRDLIHTRIKAQAAETAAAPRPPPSALSPPSLPVTNASVRPSSVRASTPAP